MSRAMCMSDCNSHSCMGDPNDRWSGIHRLQYYHNCSYACWASGGNDLLNDTVPGRAPTNNCYNSSHRKGAHLWTHVCHERPTVQQSPQQQVAPPTAATINSTWQRAPSSQTASVHTAVPDDSVTLLTSQRYQEVFQVAPDPVPLEPSKHMQSSSCGAWSSISLATPRRPCQSQSGCSC